MKHFRKVCAVLLAALMVAVILPTFSLFESTPVEAADIGVLVNGGFESGYTSTPHSSGSDSYNKANEGWTQNEWATSIQTGTKQAGSFAARITGHNSVKDATALEQIIPVNFNATYTLTFYVKGRSYKSGCDTVYSSGFNYSVDVGPTASNFTTALATNAVPSVSSTNWTQITYTVQVGANNRYLRLRFIALGDDNGDSYLDTISLTVVNEGDTGTHAKPSFVNFGNELNRPKTAADNVVTQPSFEATTNAQWNTSTFIKANLSVANDPDAKDGNKVLLYNNPGTVESWHYFDLDLPAGGNYVLSAWVKSPFLSATNQGTASIGIIDPDTNKFFMSDRADYKGHTSTPTLQIRSTATDNQWHLRSVTFFVGAAGTVKIGVYGKQSQLYIDDISVHLETNGTKYVGDQTGALTATNNTSNMYCESENNLIPDCNMTGANAENFWKTASGWNNGFMNFNKEETRLEFNGTGATGKKIYHYIKWIPVEPDTKYTVSYDYRITATGSGQLRFIDNNIDLPKVFNTLNFSAATSDWTTKSFTFSTGNYNRIGIVLTDGTGTVYFDDFRFFKTSDGIADEPAEEVFPTLKPEHPDEGVSRMEMTETGTLGLGFLFNLEATGVTRQNWEEGISSEEVFVGDYTNGKVQAFEDGVDYKLIAAGAVITNQEEVGQNADLFVRENTTTDKKVIDVSAKKLFEDPAGKNEICFAVRITNIPESHIATMIYARPYYVFDYNDKEIVVYGDIVYDCYEEMPDINDGWLEWD